MVIGHGEPFGLVVNMIVLSMKHELPNCICCLTGAQNMPHANPLVEEMD
jgi:hypothetical protein